MGDMADSAAVMGDMAGTAVTGDMAAMAVVINGIRSTRAEAGDAPGTRT
jgi:hypothetical protein